MQNKLELKEEWSVERLWETDGEDAWEGLGPPVGLTSVLSKFHWQPHDMLWPWKWNRHTQICWGACYRTAEIDESVLTQVSLSGRWYRVWFWPCYRSASEPLMLLFCGVKKRESVEMNLTSYSSLSWKLNLWHVHLLLKNSWPREWMWNETFSCIGREITNAEHSQISVSHTGWFLLFFDVTYTTNFNFLDQTNYWLIKKEISTWSDHFK